MMPSSDFIDYINSQKNLKISNNKILINASKHFGVPKIIVAKKIKETGFDVLLNDTVYKYELEKAI